MELSNKKLKVLELQKEEEKKDEKKSKAEEPADLNSPEIEDPFAEKRKPVWKGK